MNSNLLPVISQQELDAVKENPAELITLLVSHYRKAMESDSSGQVQLTLEQYVLMGFHILDEQASAGGFIQVIENGYGAYIFHSGLSDHLRSWGAIRSASLIDSAGVLFDMKKEILEKEKTLAEFARLYQEHPEFDQLDTEFHAVKDGEKNAVRDHIMKNIERFAIMT